MTVESGPKEDVMASAANRTYPAIQGEAEVELEDEFENEFDALPARSFEAEDEWEDEAEDEWEVEGEDEWEDEQFLGGLVRAVGGMFGGGDSELESEVEFDFEAEAESEAESEGEDEDFVNPVRRIYPDAELMAHLSMHAARAQNEAEAEAFIGALIPIATRLIPRAAGLVRRHAPTLIRGTTRLSRQLRRNPATRRFVTAIPVILQRTAQSLADRAAKGQPITAETVITVLTDVAARVLRAPARRNRALGAVGTFDRRYRARARRTATTARPLPRSRTRQTRVQPRRRRRTRR
jgi:hypothetical protein